MDGLNLFNLFEKHVPSPADSLTGHAESLCILIANIICDNKPLYKVQEWLGQYSDGITGEPVSANLFNDDRLARSLSALFKADRQSLMTEASCNAIAVHKLLTDEIHNDSTTVTFMGKYNTPDLEAIKLRHGHNKDFRPDCKQIVFGLNITADGHVPLSYKLFDGNTNDDVTHIPNWNSLRTLLEKEDFIYVADCKLCSQNNLSHISDNGGRFITIVPKDRKEVKQFYKYLKENDVEWEDAFSIESSRKKSETNSYKTYEGEGTKKGFRTIFVHSSSKKNEDERKRLEKIEKATKKLKELSSKLNAYHLKTKKEIKAAIDNIYKGEFIDIKIVTERKQVKINLSKRSPLLRKGLYETKWEFSHDIQWELNEKALAEAAKTDGIFPLVTNTELEASEVLKIYKRQPFLEKRMYTKKTVLEVAPVFLKKETRIEAMLFLYFIALMIVSLIERRIRLNMTRGNIEKLPILPQRMNTKKPTWNNIRYFYRNVHHAQIIQNGICIQTDVKGLAPLHKQINELLEIPAWVYNNLTRNWWQFKET
ncbi:MAG: IS1634 family transposase [Desulfobulbaceae bacterium]|nr:IS1634 family transposase [Desulfobulbaceae bacterium]